MLSLCLSYVVTVESPSRSRVFYFFSFENQKKEVKLVTQEWKHIQPQVVITQAGTMNHGLS